MENALERDASGNLQRAVDSIMPRRDTNHSAASGGGLIEGVLKSGSAIGLSIRNCSSAYYIYLGGADKGPDYQQADAEPEQCSHVASPGGWNSSDHAIHFTRDLANALGP
jgi:hypothetical protein